MAACIWSSPIVANGVVYVGVASVAKEVGFRGNVVALDATRTGRGFRYINHSCEPNTFIRCTRERAHEKAHAALAARVGLDHVDVVEEDAEVIAALRRMLRAVIERHRRVELPTRTRRVSIGFSVNSVGKNTMSSVGSSCTPAAAARRISACTATRRSRTAPRGSREP